MLLSHVRCNAPLWGQVGAEPAKKGEGQRPAEWSAKKKRSREKGRSDSRDEEKKEVERRGFHSGKVRAENGVW